MGNRGMGWTYKRGRTWWIGIRIDGREHRESSRSRLKEDATTLLKQRLRELGAGQPIAAAAAPATFDDLARLLEADYRRQARKPKAMARLADTITHLRAFFGAETLASTITATRIKLYQDHRMAEPIVVRDIKGERHALVNAAGKPRLPAPATINREVAAPRRMFQIAAKEDPPLVAKVPTITLLREDNVRKGFFERAQFEAILCRLPDYLQPVAEAAYLTGWRAPSELLTRQRRHVDFQAGWLRLEPGETKNGKGRMFPLISQLRAVLEAQAVRTEALERATGQVIPWLFHRRGKPIQSFYKAWRTACDAAGLAGRIPHDFRRTAVRNLERAGVPRPDAMAMVGHLTESVYRRYAIVPEADLRAAGEKLAALHGQTGGQARTVVPIGRRRKGGRAVVAPAGAR